jgi:two-component SAPR family response regulator
LQRELEATRRQLAEAALAKRPGLKVLFITGYAENAVISHGHLDHDMHVMMKPFTLEALSNRVEEILSKPDA